MKLSRLALMALAGLLIMPISASAQVSPLMGIANVQFFGNDGLPLTNGCLYVYAAGTSTQAASYSDSAGTQLNTNPVCFGLGARATVWLTTANFFKLQLCSQLWNRLHGIFRERNCLACDQRRSPHGIWRFVRMEKCGWKRESTFLEGCE